MQLDPTNDAAYRGLAGAYQRLNQPDKAEETYKRAISLRPQYWRAYNMLGSFYFAQADYERAATMLQRATELDPDSYLAFSSLGATLLYLGRDADATQALERSIAIRPARDAYNNLAVALFHLHRFQDSVRNFKEALKLDASDYQTWGNLGDSYYYGGDTADAADAYRKAISMAEQRLKVNPRDPGILGDLASYHSMLGHREQALSYLGSFPATGTR